MSDEQRLRPLERRVRRLVAEGVPETDIAERFRRSPEFVHRVIALSELPRQAPAPLPASPLRPLERRILRWRDGGSTPTAIAPRFHRSPAFIERVEGLARYKLSR